MLQSQGWITRRGRRDHATRQAFRPRRVPFRTLTVLLLLLLVSGSAGWNHHGGLSNGWSPDAPESGASRVRLTDSGLVGSESAASVLIAHAPQRDARRQDEQDEVEAPERPRGRLPAYFARVVTEAQRLEIYTIQARYQEEIDALQQELEGLMLQRDEEVEGVLSDEQLAEVTRLREEAREARRRRAEERESDDGDDGGAMKGAAAG